MSQRRPLPVPKTEEERGRSLVLLKLFERPWFLEMSEKKHTLVVTDETIVRDFDTSLRFWFSPQLASLLRILGWLYFKSSFIHLSIVCLWWIQYQKKESSHTRQANQSLKFARHRIDFPRGNIESWLKWKKRTKITNLCRLHLYQHPSSFLQVRASKGGLGSTQLTLSICNLLATYRYYLSFTHSLVRLDTSNIPYSYAFRTTFA